MCDTFVYHMFLDLFLHGSISTYSYLIFFLSDIIFHLKGLRLMLGEMNGVYIYISCYSEIMQIALW